MSPYEVFVVLMFILVCAWGQDKEGDHCILDTSKEAGVCRIIGDCTVAIEEATYLAIMPQVCFYKGSLAVVCCPNSSPPRTTCLRLPEEMVNAPSTGSKAEDYCKSLPERLYPCQQTKTGFTRGNICPPILDTTVLFGPDTSASGNEIPHAAILGGNEGDKYRWWCEGSLISDSWVLAAAYCFEGWSYPLSLVGLGGEIIAGSNDTSVTTFTQVYHIIRKIPHPEYNSNIAQYNDIGLLKMDRAVIFTTSIQPACLHTGTSFTDTELVHTGKQNVLNASKETKLYKWSVREISSLECTRDARRDDVPDGIKNTTQICSRPRAVGNNCWYDQLGPLQVYNGNRVACTSLLVGIGSYTRVCQLHIATRVAPYVPWIEKIVWP